MSRLPSHVQKAILGGMRAPDMAEFVAHFIEISGGPRVFAKLMFDEFRNAKEGSLARIRVMDLVLHGMKFANQMQPPIQDVAEMSEADLTRELQDVLQKMPPDAGESTAPS